ncbi:MAG: bifunctional 2-polyprenyl-6-hydroxyphenol methylase/3-demethylubiquinol 3-O-methyltransferase UbiG [Bacteriovoracaceae bacterium]|nr:bifunctional 2-polyprenyl-6-hydroxyphenol methylase/3-demethylubiquinol 3-O-methyltransferase UbiG [Bacteriovoracaceae bacterium]
MRNEVNNQIYEEYGDRWYTDDRDPVALLREEGNFKNAWICNLHKNEKLKILDLGSGGGFLSNQLATYGHKVTGVDISQSSLDVAKKHDLTKSVQYIKGDVRKLPFEDESFDVVCAMDLLEHVNNPVEVVREASRVLRRGGKFYFHTFNRNWISFFVIIKLVEWLVPNTPKNLHVLSLFITPAELKKMLDEANLEINFQSGIRPIIFNFSIWKSLFARKVIPGIGFSWTKSLLTSYAGCCTKKS